MLRLLHIEWLKFKNYRTFWILLLISVASVPAFNYVVYDMMDNSFPKVGGKALLGSPFAFPDVWQTVAWNSSLLLLIPAILIITLITNEFTYKTHRQNVIDGLSRAAFINVKMLEILIFSVLMTIVVFITGLGFGYIGNKLTPGVSIFQETRQVIFYFIQMLSYSMIAMLIGLLVKRAGLAMGIFFIYMIMEQMVVGILRNKFKVKLVDYLPEEVSDMLIRQPYARKILNSPEQLRLWESQIPYYIAIAAVYLFMYVYLTNRRFRKSDL